jgi:hypothetical protein
MMSRRERSRTTSKKSKTSEEEDNVFLYLLDTLKNFNYNSNDYSKGFELFEEIFKFGKDFNDSEFKDFISLGRHKSVNTQIKKILVENRKWFEAFLKRFLYLCGQNNSPLIECEVRSGIEYLLEFWGDSTCESVWLSLREVLNPKKQITEYIDKGLERWIQNCGFESTREWPTRKPNDYPQNHKWWEWWQERSPNAICKSFYHKNICNYASCDHFANSVLIIKSYSF